VRFVSERAEDPLKEREREREGEREKKKMRERERERERERDFIRTDWVPVMLIARCLVRQCAKEALPADDERRH